MGSNTSMTNEEKSALTGELFDYIKKQNNSGAIQAIQKGADVNAIDDKGISPLLYVCGFSNVELAQALLNNGANIDASVSKEGDNCLMLASCMGCLDIVKMLLNAGAKKNEKNKKGINALMYACKSGHALVVQELIKSGIDKSATDNEGSSALVIASGYGRTNVVEILLGEGFDIDSTDKYGENV